MADGKVHNVASAVLALPLGITVAAFKGPVEGIGAALGSLSGILLTPDLDQEGFSAAEHWLVRKTWIFGFVWLALWYPYAKAIPHRSPLSHWPILGTVLRLAYCIILFMIIWLILGRPVLPAMPTWGWVLLRGWLVGLVVSDTAHWALDWSPKKKRRKG